MTFGDYMPIGVAIGVLSSVSQQKVILWYSSFAVNKNDQNKQKQDTYCVPSHYSKSRWDITTCKIKQFMKYNHNDYFFLVLPLRSIFIKLQFFHSIRIKTLLSFIEINHKENFSMQLITFIASFVFGKTLYLAKMDTKK